MSDDIRHDMPTLPPDARVKNFDEVALGYDDRLAFLEAERCLNCKNPPCVRGCPVGVNIPAFIRAIKEGDPVRAGKLVRLENSLATVCSRVCPQEVQCEALCVRRERLGGSVAIGNLERYASDSLAAYEKRKGEIDLKKSDVAKGISVAVVGSGPASLACACELLSSGASVTMFEALHSFGGVLRYGIPSFRLPKNLVDDQFEIAKKMGLKTVKNAVVGKSIFISELLEEFSAVFIGTGAGLPSFLGVEGENLAGVYSANEYLTRINLMHANEIGSVTPVLRGKKVVVVGAGNVAMDSARTALRMGAEVHLAYRRSRAEMPARAEEIAHAEEEGVQFHLLVNPVKILGEENVKGVRLQRMQLSEPDESGRRRPVPIEGSEFDMECDELIVALGTSPNPIIKSSCEIEVTKRGTIVADEMGRTSMKSVYAGGDATTGAATVILAMGAGKRAAKAIIFDIKQAKEEL